MSDKLTEYKGPFTIKVMDGGGRKIQDAMGLYLNLDDVVALLNRPSSSILAGVPGPWILESLVLVERAGKMVYSAMLVGFKGVRVEGDGPTPESAVRDAADKVGV